MLLRAAAIWFLLVIFAILNGTVRTYLLVPLAGNGAAHVISSITLSILIFAVAWLFIGWMHPASAGQALGLGFFWLLLTVLFEFGAGHYLSSKTRGKNFWRTTTFSKGASGYSSFSPPSSPRIWPRGCAV